MNIAGNPDGQARLTGHGLDAVPAVCRGDSCVPGGDLEAIARLLELDYDAPNTLTPAELFDRFLLVLDAAKRYMLQAHFDGLSIKSPDRDRSFRELCRHITLIPSAFVTAYDTGLFPRELFNEVDVPVTLTGAALARELEASKGGLASWWQTSGSEDPFDRVIETYWGAHSLHEAFERETWHVAQHTRQVMMFLEMLGLAPDRPLTAGDLAGLPLPEGVWD